VSLLGVRAEEGSERDSWTEVWMSVWNEVVESAKAKCHAEGDFDVFLEGC